MTRYLLPLTLIVALAVLATCCGCELPGDERQLELQKQCNVARGQVSELTRQVEKLAGIVEQQNTQVENLQKLGKKRLGYLFTVEKIEIGRHTGGIDLDKKPGQDAIKVFMKPIDSAGTVLKAAGDVKIQLFDLAEEGPKRLFAEFTYPVKDIGKHFSGGFLTYHYSFECKWEKPPRHDQITVRVEFTDYLTGKTHTAQKFCKIILPPAEIRKPMAPPKANAKRDKK